LSLSQVSPLQIQSNNYGFLSTYLVLDGGELGPRDTVGKKTAVPTFSGGGGDWPVCR
jgi:hypothetical protein